MPARKPRPSDEKPQFERFLDAVREFEADETDEMLDGTLRKVIKSGVPSHSASRSDSVRKKSRA
jgi:hypothetical protein